MTFTTLLIIWIVCGIIAFILWLIHTGLTMGKVTAGDLTSIIPMIMLGCIGLLIAVGILIEENVRYDAIIWRKKP